MSYEKLKVGIDNVAIVAEIHHTHSSLQNIKSFIKDNFAEYYFGRSSIIIYQDLLASLELNQKREKLVNWFIKNSKLEQNNPIVAKRVIDAYKKQIKIKITTQDIIQDIIAIRITKKDDTIMSLELRKDSSGIIFNYLKSRFIFALLNYNRETSTLLLNTTISGFEETLLNILNKKSIVGKKVIYIYDRKYINSFSDSEFRKDRGEEYSYNTQDSLKEYMSKIKNSYTLLELNNHIKDISMIKKQYYKMAKKLHPDNYYKEGDMMVESYKNQFMQVKEAYEILKEYVEKRSA